MKIVKLVKKLVRDALSALIVLYCVSLHCVVALWCWAEGKSKKW